MKDLPTRTASDNKAFNFAKNSKHDGYQRGLGSIVYNVFDEKTAAHGAVKNENISHQQLAKELHKPIIRKIKKWKVCLSFVR